MQTNENQCIWCGAISSSREKKCSNCGAPVVASSQHVNSLDVPPVPRSLPKWFFMKMALSEVLFIVGAIFSFVGTLFGILFPILGFLNNIFLFILIGGIIGLIFCGLGYTFLFFSTRNILKKITTYRLGRSCIGRIIDIYTDRSLQVNGRSPIAIVFEYEVNQEMYEGTIKGFHRSLYKYQVNNSLTVLYQLKEPSVSIIYPYLF